ncbi:hypothetical protein LTR66_010260 [Elasticomyces elasticus]|nr:hypothetical protein LTR66_010260 [Elasticomyces elasticus]
MDSLSVPTSEQLREIAARQDAKEKETKATKSRKQIGDEEAAAELIQVRVHRNYRGYRQRRQLKGFRLDPSTRWLEAVKEDVIAQYQRVTRPTSRRERSSKSPVTGSRDEARLHWKRAGAVVRRAGGDDTSETESEDGMNSAQKEKHRQKKREEKLEREKNARTMGLEYFLEMVDHKHRYGSNLRAYHRVWQQAETDENFFYWLDYGEGKEVSLPDRSRKRLDEEQVRYLSREERQEYLVKIDNEGRLCWAKNGIRITTSPEWKDSMHGIVPVSDKAPSWREATVGEKSAELSDDASSSDAESHISVGSHEDADRYVNQDLHNAKGVNKIKQVSANAILNSLLRKSTKKNTWIFVADTSFRLYIGIKQSGAFQHSSFLHGARIFAAGLIRIKDGQLRRLSPLSGHYSPPAASFRHFVKNLKEVGTDMSRVSISRSYAVIVGLESYIGAKKSVKHGGQKIKDLKDGLLHPEELKMREEKARDTSRSAEKERAILAAQAEKDEELKRQTSLTTKIMRKIRSKDEEREER